MPAELNMQNKTKRWGRGRGRWQINLPHSRHNSKLSITGTTHIKASKTECELKSG